ncbi:MAG: MBL fold metallo-hydrolase [Cyclobacteriaceae bacterium]
MRIKTFVFNPFYENTYVVSSESGNAIIVDPGCYEPFEVDDICSYIQSENLTVKRVLNTHCHIDHVLGNEAMKEKFKCTLSIPVNEKEIFKAVTAYAPQWGITGYRHSEVDEFLKDGEIIELDEIKLKMIEVPGHSPGHLMFYEESQKLMIGGDVLFRESIGRTDLPGGNHDQLLKNIQERVYTLPDEVTVHPGHGPETTIGHEKKNNPFVRG